MLNSEEPILLYLKHPTESKNRGFDEIFETYARDNHEYKTMRMNIVNQSEVMKFE